MDLRYVYPEMPVRKVRSEVWVVCVFGMFSYFVMRSAMDLRSYCDACVGSSVAE